VEMAEVDNALAGLMREISTRFDFRGSQCSVKREETALVVLADDALKLKQMQELLKAHVTRRKVDARVLDFAEPEKAAGSTLRQRVTLRQGIDRELAKKLVQAIKDSKLKVQAAIQGDELRVSGKKRDDLQAAMAALRAVKQEQPLQFVNFRE
jgi:cyclic-di-GMP-binding protein